MPFKDILTAVITEGDTATCVLQAVGQGSAIQCDDSLDVLDFGTIWWEQKTLCTIRGIFAWLSYG